MSTRRGPAHGRARGWLARVEIEPTAGGIEGQERHQHDVGLKHRLVGFGLGDAPYGLIHGVARRPGAEDERQALALHDRHGERMALAVEAPQQRPGAELIRERGEARNDGPFLGKPQGL
jgi:hypothetical protein